VVTLCTTKFDIKNSSSAHTLYFMYFVWIFEQTAITSLYTINWLVFMTETGCVYCAVRAEYVLRGGAVGWGTALQTGRSRFRFPMVSLEFFIEIILPAALWL
jgi:hypothetical protein